MGPLYEGQEHGVMEDLVQFWMVLNPTETFHWLPPSQPLFILHSSSYKDINCSEEILQYQAEGLQGTCSSVIQGMVQPCIDRSRGNISAGRNLSQLLSDSFSALSSESKATKTSDEPDFRSALILYLVSNDFHPVKHRGVIFLMGILVRRVERRESKKLTLLHAPHSNWGQGTQQLESGKLFSASLACQNMFLLRYKEGKVQSPGTAPTSQY